PAKEAQGGGAVARGGLPGHAEAQGDDAEGGPATAGRGAAAAGEAVRGGRRQAEGGEVPREAEGRGVRPVSAARGGSAARRSPGRAGRRCNRPPGAEPWG